ncbi:MAG: hypothetical protein PX640_09490 [Microcystis sp. M49629_WE12]|nr:hypothetical protein [Pseudanabaena sp. M172S2SP2A07QC]MCA6563644.1 hypothetical protein [Pseudanabaena sp. M151S2SP2A07QC]MDJ0564165.1 hypothetical protein [Microcystis sp. M49629_WE12]
MTSPKHLLSLKVLPAPVAKVSNTRPASPAFLAWATFSKAARVAASW